LVVGRGGGQARIQKQRTAGSRKPLPELILWELGEVEHGAPDELRGTGNAAVMPIKPI
jgi:hypothetical protein